MGWKAAESVRTPKSRTTEGVAPLRSFLSVMRDDSKLLTLLRWLPGLLALWVLLLPPSSAEAREVRRIDRSFHVDGAEVLRLKAPLGTFRFERGRTSLEVHVILGCSGDWNACRAAAKGVQLTSRVHEGVKVIELEHKQLEEWWRYGKLKKGGWEMTVEGVVRYPEVGRLDIDLGTGAIELRTLDVDTGIHVARGRVSLSVERARMGSVELCSRQGQVVFVDQNGRDLIKRNNPFREKPGRIHWSQGEGFLDLEILVDQGEVRVQLLDAPR